MFDPYDKKIKTLQEEFQSMGLDPDEAIEVIKATGMQDLPGLYSVDSDPQGRAKELIEDDHDIEVGVEEERDDLLGEVSRKVTFKRKPRGAAKAKAKREYRKKRAKERIRSKRYRKKASTKRRMKLRRKVLAKKPKRRGFRRQLGGMDQAADIVDQINRITDNSLNTEQSVHAQHVEAMDLATQVAYEIGKFFHANGRHEAGEAMYELAEKSLDVLEALEDGGSIESYDERMRKIMSGITMALDAYENVADEVMEAKGRRKKCSKKKKGEQGYDNGDDDDVDDESCGKPHKKPKKKEGSDEYPDSFISPQAGRKKKGRMESVITPERALEILESKTMWGFYGSSPTKEERAVVTEEVWRPLPSWAGFDDALIIVAWPAMVENDLDPDLVNRAKFLHESIGDQMEAMFSIDPGGLRRISEGGIRLQPNTIYWIGASTSPDMIIVTDVNDKFVEYMHYPFYGVKKIRTQRPIADDLIRQGSETWLKRSGKRWPEQAKSIKAMLAGKKGKTVNIKDFEPMVFWLVPSERYKGKDLWREAEKYGGVGGLMAKYVETHGLKKTKGGKMVSKDFDPDEEAYEVMGTSKDFERAKKDKMFDLIAYGVRAKPRQVEERELDEFRRGRIQVKVAKPKSAKREGPKERAAIKALSMKAFKGMEPVEAVRILQDAGWQQDDIRNLLKQGGWSNMEIGRLMRSRPAAHPGLMIRQMYDDKRQPFGAVEVGYKVPVLTLDGDEVPPGEYAFEERRKYLVLNADDKTYFVPKLREGLDSLDNHTLEQFIDMAAESAGLHCGGIRVPKTVIREAQKFERECEKALKDWVKRNPGKLAQGYDADDLYDAQGPYLVLMTLRGEGVGIWDGDWDHFFVDNDVPKDLEKYLDRKLGKFADDTGGGSLNMAFNDAAYEQCGGEEESVQEAIGTEPPMPEGLRDPSMWEDKIKKNVKESIKALTRAGAKVKEFNPSEADAPFEYVVFTIGKDKFKLGLEDIHNTKAVKSVARILKDVVAMVDKMHQSRKEQGDIFYSDVHINLKRLVGDKAGRHLAFSIATDILRNRGMRLWSDVDHEAESGLAEEQREEYRKKKKEDIDLTEGTWAIPDTVAKMKKLGNLLKKKLPVGDRADDGSEWAKGSAGDLLGTIWGNDVLFDALGNLYDAKGPKADARPVIRKHLAVLKRYLEKNKVKPEVIAVLDSFTEDVDDLDEALERIRLDTGREPEKKYGIGKEDEFDLDALLPSRRHLVEQAEARKRIAKMAAQLEASVAVRDASRTIRGLRNIVQMVGEVLSQFDTLADDILVANQVADEIGSYIQYGDITQADWKNVDRSMIGLKSNADNMVAAERGSKMLLKAAAGLLYDVQGVCYQVDQSLGTKLSQLANAASGLAFQSEGSPKKVGEDVSHEATMMNIRQVATLFEASRSRDEIDRAIDGDVRKLKGKDKEIASKGLWGHVKTILTFLRGNGMDMLANWFVDLVTQGRLDKFYIDDRALAAGKPVESGWSMGKVGKRDVVKAVRAIKAALAEDVELTEKFSPKDDRVLEHFTNSRKADGDTLSTDGRELRTAPWEDKVILAKWVKGERREIIPAKGSTPAVTSDKYIEFTKDGKKRPDLVKRLKSLTTKSWFAEEEDLDEGMGKDWFIHFGSLTELYDGLGVLEKAGKKIQMAPGKSSAFDGAPDGWLVKKAKNIGFVNEKVARECAKLLKKKRVPFTLRDSDGKVITNTIQMHPPLKGIEDDVDEDPEGVPPEEEERGKEKPRGKG